MTEEVENEMLLTQYEDIDLIPEKYRDLYSASETGYVLSGIADLKTIKDVEKIGNALNMQRRDNSTLSKENSSLKKMLSELQNGDKEAENTNFSIKKKIEILENQLQEEQTKNQNYVNEMKKNKIKEEVMKAARNAKVVNTAYEDIELLASNIFDVTDTGVYVTSEKSEYYGSDAVEWMNNMKTSRPHWWAGSTVGAGSKGSTATGMYKDNSNPFTKDGWNLTKQGLIMQENRVTAEQMARAAGTKIGGDKPRN